MTAPATVAPIEVVDDTGNEIRVRFPVLALEGMDTGDGRFINPDGLTNRALPISLLAQPYTSHGGQEPPPAEVFGSITSLTPLAGPDVTSPRTGQPYGPDVRVWTGEGVIDGGHKFADLVRKGYLRGVSVDLADLDAELVDEETAALSDHPRRQIIVHSGEIAAATMVPVPAFADAYVELIGDDAGGQLPLAASALPAGMLLDPQPIWRSVEIGDSIACAPEGAIKTLRGGKVSPKTVMPVTAAATTVPRPPLTWFTDPGFTTETPITIEDIPGSSYRHVFGHIGVRSRPHIGFGGKTVHIPRSRCDYEEFMRGGFRVDDDGTPRIVAVGHLTANTGHADLSLSASSTVHFYDHSGFAWADVAAGDDEIGVWVNGVTKLGITDEQLDCALAHPPSGDWRPLRGGLELIAVINVNVPGFGVYRARVASGAVQAMVASSGVMPQMPATSMTAPLDYDALADALAVRLEARQQRAAALCAQRTSLLAELDDSPARVAALLAEFEADDFGDFGVLNEKPGSNWIENLPAALRDAWDKSIIYRAAIHMHEKGRPVGASIAAAINWCKHICDTGDVKQWSGPQQVKPSSRAECCAAVALWDSMKAASKTKTESKKL